MVNPSHDLTVTSGDRQVTLDDLDRHLATCQRCVTYGRALAAGYDPSNDGGGDHGYCDSLEAIHVALDAQSASS